MPSTLPPLAALRALTAVAQEGSFTRAAQSLNVTVSAVSHQLRALEASVGARLLVRARNGAGRTVVTDDGKTLLAATHAAFAQLAAACDEVRNRNRRPTLVISAAGSVLSLWLARRIATFAALHPSVTWQVRAIEETPDLIAELLDVAVVRLEPDQLTRHDTLLFRESIFPVASPSMQVSPSTLAAYSLLQEEGGSPERSWDAGAAGHRGKPAQPRPVQQLQRRDRRSLGGGGRGVGAFAASR